MSLMMFWFSIPLPLHIEDELIGAQAEWNVTICALVDSVHMGESGFLEMVSGFRKPVDGLRHNNVSNFEKRVSSIVENKDGWNNDINALICAPTKVLEKGAFESFHSGGSLFVKNPFVDEIVLGDKVMNGTRGRDLTLFSSISSFQRFGQPNFCIPVSASHSILKSDAVHQKSGSTKEANLTEPGLRTKDWFLTHFGGGNIDS